MERVKIQNKRFLLLEINELREKFVEILNTQLCVCERERETGRFAFFALNPSLDHLEDLSIHGSKT
jgi:hypothetical protein